MSFNRTKFERLQRLTKACRVVGKDVSAGKVKPGSGALVTEGNRPCCAMGHVLSRAHLLKKSTAQNRYNAVDALNGMGLASSHASRVAIGRVMSVNDDLVKKAAKLNRSLTSHERQLIAKSVLAVGRELAKDAARMEAAKTKTKSKKNKSKKNKK